MDEIYEKVTENENEQATKIGVTAEVTGDIWSENDIDLFGIVTGNIESLKSVVIKGRLEGNIKSSFVSLVSGQIRGNVTADEDLLIDRNSTLEGEVRAARVILGRKAERYHKSGGPGDHKRKRNFYRQAGIKKRRRFRRGCPER